MFLFKKEKLLAIIIITTLFILAFLYLSIDYKFLNLEVCHYDEGTINYTATRIMKGDILYKEDLFLFYTPAQVYILTFLFKIFGISLLTERMYTLMVLSLLTIVVYLYVLNVSSRRIALLSFLLTLGWLKIYPVYGRPQQPALLLCILSLLVILNYLHTHKKKWVFIAGLLTGIAILFRQDFGFYLFISISLFILVYNIKIFLVLKKYCESNCDFLKDNLLLISGILVIILPFLTYFYIKSDLRELLFCIFTYPIFIYPAVRALPYPQISLKNIIFYFPFLIIFLSIIRFLVYFRIQNIDRKNWSILLCIFLGIGMLNYVRVRSDFSYLLYPMIPIILLGCLVMEDIFKMFSPQFKHIVYGVFLLGCFVFVFHFGKIAFLNCQNTENFKLSIKRAQGFYDNSNIAKSQLKTIRYIQKNSSPQEKIFVANTRHDMIINTDVMFYFLSRRDAAGYLLHPLVSIFRVEQKRVIKDLKKNNVRYIIQWRGRGEFSEPNKAGKSSGIFLLDNFINKNYEIEKDFGEYVVLHGVKSCY